MESWMIRVGPAIIRRNDMACYAVRNELSPAEFWQNKRKYLTPWVWWFCPFTKHTCAPLDDTTLSCTEYSVVNYRRPFTSHTICLVACVEFLRYHTQISTSNRMSTYGFQDDSMKPKSQHKHRKRGRWGPIRTCFLQGLSHTIHHRYHQTND